MEPVEIDVVAQQPIPIRVKGTDGMVNTYHLPLLGIRGLLPWLAEMTESIRASDRAALAKAKGLHPRDILDAERMISRNEAIIADLTLPLQTPAGIERAIRLSLDKSDVPVDQREMVLDALLSMGYVSINLAQQLSTLFAVAKQAAPADDQKKMGSDPLDSQPPQSGSDVSATKQTGLQAA